MEKVLFIGCGGHSRSAADILLARFPDCQIVFVDEYARDNERIMGFPVLRAQDIRDCSFFIAIGSNEKRRELYLKHGTEGLVSVISPFAHISPFSVLGKGCMVGSFCHIGPEAVVGDNTIINNGAVVDHEVRIGAHCHIGPNATISGRSSVGELVFVGVGATIKDSVSICSNVVIGAGATVVKNIADPGVYIGTPARRMG